MSLSNEQKKHYRSIGHNLNPIVTISNNGLSKPVLAEIDRALYDHELIKIKCALNDKNTRKKLIQAIANLTHSVLIQEIGKVALILRTSKKPNAKLSNLLR